MSEHDNKMIFNSSTVTGMTGRHRLQKTKATPRNARYLRTGSWVDVERRNLQAYEYLCHIGEVKEWIEKVIGEEIAPITYLNEDLRNGIVLAKLVLKFEPQCVKKIFEGTRLQYRHSDNINYVFTFLTVIGLPDNFKFELTDLYDKKNIPKVIYCFHAVSHLLHKRKLAPSINDLVGFLSFTSEEIEGTKKELEGSAGGMLLNFKGVKKQLAKEMNESGRLEEISLDMSEGMSTLAKVSTLAKGHLVRCAWLARDEFAEPFAIQIQAKCRQVLIKREYDDKLQNIQETLPTITKMQARSRGVLARKEKLEREFELEASNQSLCSIQGLCRGYLERQTYKTKKIQIIDNKDQIIGIQALAKGFLAKKNHETTKLQLHNNITGVTNLQGLIRTRLARQELQYKKELLSESVPSVTKLQGLIRTKLARSEFVAKREQLNLVTQKVTGLQGLVRAKLVRDQITLKKVELNHSIGGMMKLQALARAKLARGSFLEVKSGIVGKVEKVEQIQGMVRGLLTRKKMDKLRSELEDKEEVVTRIQALIRGKLTRAKVGGLMTAIHNQPDMVIDLQSQIRGVLARKRLNQTKSKLSNSASNLSEVQGLCRGYLVRKGWERRHDQLDDHYESIVALQALARGMLVRTRWTQTLISLSTKESAISQLQALARGHIHRRRKNEKLTYYQNHEDVVVKIQSLFRAKLAKQAYYEIAMSQDPPVSAMRNFLYLLDDTDSDFTAELELEKLRQKVVRTIRANKVSEKELNDLDIKIALLVKNRTTLDDVVKSSKGLFQSKRMSTLGSDGSIISSGSSTNLSLNTPFSLKSLDRDSRSRLINYQYLFYLLQTNPTYLSKLLLNQSSAKKFVETIVLTLFNFGQNKREEYLLLRLFKQSIQEEISGVDKIEQFLRGNPVFIQLAVHYNRGGKERKYLRELLQPLIKKVLEDQELDLETDPVCIYRGIIREEESKTGTKSRKKYAVNKHSALNDPETKQVFIKHMQQLRIITSTMIDAILISLDSMPYGVRYIAKELRNSLMERFPDERPTTIIKVVGHLVYYRYINPAIIAPELFDVIETVINSVQRRNLAEIAKLLNQVSMGKLFTDENIFLQPLNNFIGYTAEKFAQYFQSVCDVEEPEIHFGIDEYLDQINLRKPTIYISYNEIISFHRILKDSSDMLAPPDDVIYTVLDKLGPPPQLMNFDDRALGKEIALVLTDPMVASNGQADRAQQMFLETKRQVLYVIKVQSGKTLLDILFKPVTPTDQARYTQLLDQELLKVEGIKEQVSHEDNGEGSPMSPVARIDEGESGMDEVKRLTTDFLANLRRLTFEELKAHILTNMDELEQYGLVTKENQFQDMINAIAKDIKNKHQRRVQRGMEFRKVRVTLSSLNEASSYLGDQKQSYVSYIRTCMVNQKATKSTKKHRYMPFSKQYFHVKGLERSGKMPKFGSYKYGADDLHKRGILESITNIKESEFSRMSLTISSDQQGVFHVGASLLGVKIPASKVEIRLDELLQLQFDNVPTMELFDSQVKVNVNLLLYLINKKFYT